MSHWYRRRDCSLIAGGLVTCYGMRISHGQSGPSPQERKDPGECANTPGAWPTREGVDVTETSSFTASWPINLAAPLPEPYEEAARLLCGHGLPGHRWGSEPGTCGVYRRYIKILTDAGWRPSEVPRG